MFNKLRKLFVGAEVSKPVIEMPGPPESDNGVHRRIAVVCDRSGSMIMIKTQTETGLASFLAEQRDQYPNTRVTLVDFNDIITTRYLDQKITDIPAYQMHPFRGTHLWEAVHHGVREMEKSIALIPKTEKSEKIVVILTDGADNSSDRRYTRETVRELITAKRAEGWVFIFLGASEDAVEVGTSMGVSSDTSLSYDLSKAGSTFTTASSMVTRGSVSGNYGATDTERINLRKG